MLMTCKCFRRAGVCSPAARRSDPWTRLRGGVQAPAPPATPPTRGPGLPVPPHPAGVAEVGPPPGGLRPAPRGRGSRPTGGVLPRPSLAREAAGSRARREWSRPTAGRREPVSGLPGPPHCPPGALSPGSPSAPWRTRLSGDLPGHFPPGTGSGLRIQESLVPFLSCPSCDGWGPPRLSGGGTGTTRGLA